MLFRCNKKLKLQNLHAKGRDWETDYTVYGNLHRETDASCSHRQVLGLTLNFVFKFETL